MEQDVDIIEIGSQLLKNLEKKGMAKNVQRKIERS